MGGGEECLKRDWINFFKSNGDVLTEVRSTQKRPDNAAVGERASRINSSRCVLRFFSENENSRIPKRLEWNFQFSKDKRFQWLEWVELCWTFLSFSFQSSADEHAQNDRINSISSLDKSVTSSCRLSHRMQMRRGVRALISRRKKYLECLKDITLWFKLLPKLFNFYVKIMKREKIYKLASSQWASLSATA